MESTKNLMYHITKQASLLLLIFAILSFIALTVFKVEYWLDAFQLKFPIALAWTMAVSVAIIVEGVRFSLMVSSAEDIANGHTAKFWLGMAGSVALLVYEVFYMAETIGHTWSSTDSTYTNLFKFLALLGMLLELRLCLLMKNSNNIPKKEKEKEKEKEVEKTNTTKIQFPNLGKYLGSNNKGESANIAD